MFEKQSNPYCVLLLLKSFVTAAIPW
uniref:Uncharacterized protein n=1 Tax=Rhizophora mucronata TaxID=61149 RepID=A0A2P2NIM2_RHIMU